MVQFGRSAPPVEPPRQPSSTLPPHTLYTEPQNLKGTQEDLIIPPQFRRYCLMGFGAQVVLDILVILVVYFQPAAFFTIPVACLCLVLDFAMLVWTYRATPRPIDVLMKNALSGVAWFMLAVINGSIISEIDNPWPPFVISLFTFLVNIAFWCWTIWWGLNDRGPRSMYSQHDIKRCFSCRNGGSGIFNLNPHTHTHAHGRRPSIPRSFSLTDGALFGGSNGIALSPLSRQSTNTTRMKDGLPSTPTSPVLRESGGRMPLRAREEPALKVKEIPGVGVRASLGHQARKHSIASTLFSEGDLAEGPCVG